MLKTAYCVEDISVSDAISVSDHVNVKEIGVDEAGRGPMFGRVYAGAVILPKSLETFNHALMKDSKKFHSEKKIREVAAYIKANAIAWAVGWADEREIDELNIRRATHKAMHQAINDILVKQNDKKNILLLVDGNDFTPFIAQAEQIQHVCIEGGDNTYSCIAAVDFVKLAFYFCIQIFTTPRRVIKTGFECLPAAKRINRRVIFCRCAIFFIIGYSFV